MKQRHFQEIRPVCPRCRVAGRADAPLGIALIARQAGDDVLEGLLACPSDDCRQEFPIIDGIPIIVPDVARFLSDNLWHIMGRDDLSPLLESLLGDAAGPGSAIDATRYHLSSYAFDHWGEFDPLERSPVTPGAVARCLNAGLDGAGAATGPALDIGCSVGRSSFVLAGRCAGLVLGVDLNFAMLRLARRALTEGVVTYPRRRIGMVYDRRAFKVPNAGADRIDFWVCDAMALPFGAGRFGVVSALNVLDCVPDPAGLLISIGGLLTPNGVGVLASPYDWSAAATQPIGWIGGHSQRGETAGAAEPRLRGLLTGAAGLRILAEIHDFPWHVRLHDRSVMVYATHVLTVSKTAAT